MTIIDLRRTASQAPKSRGKPSEPDFQFAVARHLRYSASGAAKRRNPAMRQAVIAAELPGQPELPAGIA